MTINTDMNSTSNLLLNFTMLETMVSNILAKRSAPKKMPIMNAMSLDVNPILPSIKGMMEMKATSPVKHRASPKLMLRYLASFSKDMSMDLMKDCLLKKALAGVVSKPKLGAYQMDNCSISSSS